MKFDIHLFRSVNSEERRKYICSSKRSGIAGIHLVEQIDLKDEDHLRQSLKGILSSSDIESTIKTLEAPESAVSRFPRH